MFSAGDTVVSKTDKIPVLMGLIFQWRKQNADKYIDWTVCQQNEAGWGLGSAGEGATVLNIRVKDGPGCVGSTMRVKGGGHLTEEELSRQRGPRNMAQEGCQVLPSPQDSGCPNTINFELKKTPLSHSTVFLLLP